MQVSNNRVHSVITWVQPVNPIWVTLDFFEMLHHGLSFLQVMNHFETEFFSLLAEMTCESADKSHPIVQSPTLGLVLEFAWKIGCHVWVIDTGSSSGRVWTCACVCIWTCPGQEVNHKCTLQIVAKGNVKSSLKLKEGHRRWRISCNREWEEG